VAAVAFLLYIAAGIAGMILARKASAGETVTAKLASIAQHVSMYRASILAELVACLCALVLAVTLWAITRDADPGLAMMVLVARATEGIVGAAALPRSMAKLWLATSPPDPASRDAIAATLFTLPSRTAQVCATFFAIGSAIFAWLLLRGRMVPAGLAWLGLAASILLVIVLPFELIGILEGTIAQVIWAPMAVFEIWLAVYMLIKGVRAPRVASPASNR
jgi:Domain of unknown function (DUF4386)